MGRGHDVWPDLGLYHDNKLGRPMTQKGTRDKWRIEWKPGVFNAVTKKLLRLLRASRCCVGD